MYNSVTTSSSVTMPSATAMNLMTAYPVNLENTLYSNYVPQENTVIQ